MVERIHGKDEVSSSILDLGSTNVMNSYEKDIEKLQTIKLERHRLRNNAIHSLGAGILVLSIYLQEYDLTVGLFGMGLLLFSAANIIEYVNSDKVQTDTINNMVRDFSESIDTWQKE